MTIADSLVTGNRAVGGRGGMGGAGGDGFSPNVYSVSGTQDPAFYHRTAPEGGAGGNGAGGGDGADAVGGGIVIDQGTLTIVRSTVAGNQALAGDGNSGGHGGKGGDGYLGAADGAPGRPGASGAGGAGLGGGLFAADEYFFWPAKAIGPGEAPVVTVTDSAFRDNRATGGRGGQSLVGAAGGPGGAGAGGGLYLHRAGAGTRVLNSTFVRNEATGGAGAAGALDRFTGRAGGAGGHARGGAAVVVGGPPSFASTTFTRNRAAGGPGGPGGPAFDTAFSMGGNGGSAGDGRGGALFVAGGPTELTNATVSGNRAAAGSAGAGGAALVPGRPGAAGVAAGGGLAAPADPAALRLRNTIVAANDGGEVSGAFTSLATNLIGNADGAVRAFTPAGDTDLAGTAARPLDPRLGPEGPDGTLPLLADSPAIDAGTAAPDLPATDQRGKDRVAGRAVDIGAYEFGSNAAPVARAGGPYAVREGRDLTLDASASADGDGEPLTYSWDLNGDGTFGDATGDRPTVSWDRLQALGLGDGPAAGSVRVRVDDGRGGTHLVVSDPAPLAIDNARPTATLTAGGPVVEGRPVAVTFADAADPSAADTAAGFRYSLATEPAGLAITYAAAGTAAAGEFTFARAGTYAVYGRVFDKDGDFTEYQVPVTVTGAPPLLTAPADQTAAEGRKQLFRLGDFSGLDPARRWRATVDWGDGRPAETFTPSRRGMTGRPHTYADSGDYQVRLTLTAADGATASTGFRAAVTNTAPTGQLIVVRGLNPAQRQVLLAGATDPSAADTAAGFRYSFALSPGGLATSYAAAGAGASAVLSFPESGHYTISARVFDQDGGFTDYTRKEVVLATGPLTVPQVSPAPFQTTVRTVAEGTAKEFALGSFTDAGAADGPWAVEVNWGDGAAESFVVDRTGSLPPREHTYVRSGMHVGRVTVTDRVGAGGSAAFLVKVTNVAPVITPAALQKVDEGTSRLFQLGSFADPGAERAWRVTVSWGDGATESFSVGAAGDLPARPHVYKSSGRYTARVTVADDGSDGRWVNGQSAPASFDVSVANVAPTGRLVAGPPGPAGEPVRVWFEEVTDPSAADRAAGFRYSFALSPDALAATYRAAATSRQASFTFAEGGTYTVYGRVFDRDGGYTDYEIEVTVLPPSGTPG